MTLRLTTQMHRDAQLLEDISVWCSKMPDLHRLMEDVCTACYDLVTYQPVPQELRSRLETYHDYFKDRPKEEDYA